MRILAIALKSSPVLVVALATVSMAILLVAVALAAGAPWNTPGAGAAGNVNTSSSALGKIVFSSNRDGNSDIYVMNGDGSDQTRLTNNPAGASDPVWSPDGSRILFNVQDCHTYLCDPGLYVMNADGSHPTRLATGNSPAWSPDGTKIAFQLGFFGPIHIMNADGSGDALLANGMHPAWSPDGTKIAFALRVQDTSTQALGYAPGGQIHVMNSDGSNLVRLTAISNDVLDAWPRWSPDGTRIAFVEYPISTFGTAGIRVMNTDGSGNTFVTEGIWGRLAWSPDSSRLSYTLQTGNSSDVYAVNANGSAATNLTNNPAQDYNGDWIAGSVATPTVQGGFDCGAIVDTEDLSLLLEYVAGLDDGTIPGCLKLGSTTSGGYPWGDVNCDGQVNALDALYILAHLAGIDMAPVAGNCVPIGQTIVTA